MELKPCPFCGAPSEIKISGFGYGGKAVRVVCSECRAETRPFTIGGGHARFDEQHKLLDFRRDVSQKEAVEQSIFIWNRREVGV